MRQIFINANSADMNSSLFFSYGTALMVNFFSVTQAIITGCDDSCLQPAPGSVIPNKWSNSEVFKNKLETTLPLSKCILSLTPFQYSNF